MSKIKIEKAYAKHRVSSFGGMREGLSKNGESASEIRNLRITSDGSLEKRSGWRLWKSFSDPLRGFWEGTLNDEYYVFAVAGKNLYRVYDTQNSVLIGLLNTTEGQIHFLRYNDRLYLPDGDTIRVFDTDTESFVLARGYVPLYGRNWHPTQMGDVNEPLNLMNQNLRIHYLNARGEKSFTLPFFASSLDSVRVNNQRTTAYTFTPGSDSFTLPSAAAGDSVEVAMTISGTNALNQQLHRVTRGCLYRNGALEQLFLYGAPQGYRIFGTTSVSDIMLAACSVFYSDCDPLYCTQSQMLLIGDTDHPVTAITPNFDRLLAFTTKETHSISIDRDQLYSYPVLSDLGCSAKDATAQIGNDVIVLNARGVCRLHATASDPDSLSVSNLSEALGTTWSKNLSESTVFFWDNVKQELWVMDISKYNEGIVWIWNAELEEWYCFDGIRALFFAFYQGKILFGAEKDLRIFEEGLGNDGGTDFNAYYQSNYMSFDSASAIKRALRVVISATTDGSDLQLDLETENMLRSFLLEGKNRNAPSVLDVRFAPGRFRFFRYRITCIGNRASKIHEANFFTTL